ncbi:hypothetical protein, partial [Neisseria sp. oral taxon 020]|uniref:hypothetical protein n=1 Tax=Neisseria sp. oral taxon 020 TaxID=712401 RepID=UPI001E315DDF
ESAASTKLKPKIGLSDGLCTVCRMENRKAVPACAGMTFLKPNIPPRTRLPLLRPRGGGQGVAFRRNAFCLLLQPVGYLCGRRPYAR